MNGRGTLIITLQWYFHAPDNRIFEFNAICDLLLTGLNDESSERTPNFFDMENEINALVLTFLPVQNLALGTIQRDLWTILVNWWDGVIWDRRAIRAPMGTADLLADLVAHIVQIIVGNPQTKPYYKRYVLEALIQMNTPPDIQLLLM